MQRGRREVQTAWSIIASIAALSAVACLLLNIHGDMTSGDVEPHPVTLAQIASSGDFRILDPNGPGGPLEAASIAHKDSIPTLKLANVKTKDLKQIQDNGASLRAALQEIIQGLAGKSQAERKTASVQHQDKQYAHKASKSGMQKLDYSEAVNDPHHNEPYDKNFEEKEWTAIAREFRAAHPDMDPKQEQKEIDSIWRDRHPWYYHAYGPTPLHHKPARSGSPPPPPHPPHPAGPPRHGTAPPPPLVYPAYQANPLQANGDDVPATVLAPPDDGIRDFDGAYGIKANLPRLGHGRTKLDDYQKEVRGSFAVRVYGAFGQPELEVTRMWGGAVHPFTCTYRGYRKLTGDFQGNVVLTGFKRVFHSEGDPPKILTGMDIPPSGNTKEFDIMTCRDTFSGEVQYFKLHPELVLARMRERYCAGYIPAGTIGACGW